MVPHLKKYLYYTGDSGGSSRTGLPVFAATKHMRSGVTSSAPFRISLGGNTHTHKGSAFALFVRYVCMYRYTPTTHVVFILLILSH